MVSDIKAIAGTIFGLPSEYFLRDFPRESQAECRALLVNPHGKHTKFAPVLFPNPQNMQPATFLKTAKLVQILKVALFGKSSLSQTHAPGPKTKVKIWGLRHTTAGMIAAAAVVGIFVLSGDKELLAKKGDKTGIPYHQYHNFYCQRLLSNTPWADGVFRFFNDSLFTDSSSGTAGTDPSQPVQVNDWEAEFEHAMLEDGSGSNMVAGHDVSVAMQNLSLQSQAPAAPVPVSFSVGPNTGGPVPTAVVPVSAAAIPEPAAAISGSITVPVAVPLPAAVPVPGPTTYISAPVPGPPVALSIAAGHAPGLALQHQGAALAGFPSISAPVPALISPVVQLPIPGPDDQEVGAAAAELAQKKAKSKSKCTKVVNEAIVEDNAGGRKTRSKKGAAK